MQKEKRINVDSGVETTSEKRHKTIHWLSRHPTPYNAGLFRALSAEESFNLIVHFRDPILKSHPWQSYFKQGYISRVYDRTMGVDWHLLSIAKKEQNSIFIIAGWDHPTSIILINYLMLMRRKFILWTDTPELKRKRSLFFSFIRSFWLRIIFNCAYKIMGTGKPAIEALQKMGASKNKLIIFPYFVDIDYYTDNHHVYNTGDEQIVKFVSSGRLVNSLKGHDIALIALSKVASITEKQFIYFIVGTGADQQTLKEMAQKLEIGDKVKCLGWIEQNKLTELLHSTDVLIHPSPVHEPYGVAVIEAMASGVVVLASDATCAGIDRIAHGVNGFIHPSGNTQILAEQILFLLKNPKRIEEIGRKARLTAEEWPISRGVEIVKKAI